VHAQRKGKRDLVHTEGLKCRDPFVSTGASGIHPRSRTFDAPLSALEGTRRF